MAKRSKSVKDVGRQFIDDEAYCDDDTYEEEITVCKIHNTLMQCFVLINKYNYYIF